MSAPDPPYLAALKGEYGVTKMGWFQSYKKAFIDTGRFRPVLHIIGFVVCVGYLMEFPHLRRKHQPPTASPVGCGGGASPLRVPACAPFAC